MCRKTVGSYPSEIPLTHSDLDKMVVASQAIFSIAVLWNTVYSFWFKFHFGFFPKSQVDSM